MSNPYNEAKAQISQLLQQMDQMKLKQLFPDDKALHMAVEDAREFVETQHQLHMTWDDRYCGAYAFFWSKSDAEAWRDYGHEEITHYIIDMKTLGFNNS